jgi:hypothetical protein
MAVVVPGRLCVAIAIARFRRTGRRWMRRASAAAALLHKHLKDQVGVAGKQMVSGEGSTAVPWWPARGRRKRVVAGNGETAVATKCSATGTSEWGFFFLSQIETCKLMGGS